MVQHLDLPSARVARRVANVAVQISFELWLYISELASQNAMLVLIALCTETRDAVRFVLQTRDKHARNRCNYRIIDVNARAVFYGNYGKFTKYIALMHPKHNGYLFVDSSLSFTRDGHQRDTNDHDNYDGRGSLNRVHALNTSTNFTDPIGLVQVHNEVDLDWAQGHKLTVVALKNSHIKNPWTLKCEFCGKNHDNASLKKVWACCRYKLENQTLIEDHQGLPIWFHYNNATEYLVDCMCHLHLPTIHLSYLLGPNPNHLLSLQ